MVIYKRKDYETTDVLDCPDEELRKGFMRSARTIGRLQSDSGDTTAHILHVRPLIVGAISTEDQGRFYPESPGYYSKFSQCELKERHARTNYSVYQCEDLPGAVTNLDFTFPKIQNKGKTVEIAYVDGNKVVDDEKSVIGGVIMKLGGNQMYGVVGMDGKEIKVDEFRDIYNRNVWPDAKMHFFDVRRRYFSYFREYEASKGIRHSGLKGTRYRDIQLSYTFNYYRAMIWNKIKSAFGFNND